jgi:uncharacterized protein YbjT (DUF2867 family)
MKILILGATGFIGSTVARRLAGDGHAIAGLGRSIESASARMPFVVWLRNDLRQMTTPDAWSKALAGVDIVVNCAGALQDGLRDDLQLVHDRAMTALYAAAVTGGIKRIVQISIPKMDHVGATAFQKTKLDADAALAASGLDHVILRPAIVIGRNAYGGSALLRALAALPLVTPLIHARQTLQAVSLDDVADTVAVAVDGGFANGTDMLLAAPQRWTLAELVALHRQWLGLKPAPVVAIPSALARPISLAADLAGHLGWRSPLRSTALAVAAGGIAAPPALPTDIQRQGRDIRQTLLSDPAGVQDLWFARLYLLKAGVIGILSLFWLASGLVPLLDVQATASRFSGTFAPTAATALVLATCLADIVLGLAVLYRPWAKTAMTGMIALSLAYLLSGSLIEPGLWLDPLGPLVKVLPSIVLALVGLAVLEER